MQSLSTVQIVEYYACIHTVCWFLQLILIVNYSKKKKEYNIIPTIILTLIPFVGLILTVVMVIVLFESIRDLNRRTKLKL